jgi:hypothetical protein
MVLVCLDVSVQMNPAREQRPGSFLKFRSRATAPGEIMGQHARPCCGQPGGGGVLGYASHCGGKGSFGKEVLRDGMRQAQTGLVRKCSGRVRPPKGSKRSLPSPGCTAGKGPQGPQGSKRRDRSAVRAVRRRTTARILTKYRGIRGPDIVVRRGPRTTARAAECGSPVWFAAAPEGRRPCLPASLRAAAQRMREDVLWGVVAACPLDSGWFVAATRPPPAPRSQWLALRPVADRCPRPPGRNGWHNHIRDHIRDDWPVDARSSTGRKQGTSVHEMHQVDAR